jgi:MSHA biogenesis protein MshQ
MMGMNRLRVLLLPLLLCASGLTYATTYTLPGSFGSGVFSSCSLTSGTTYTCTSDISLSNNDVVNLSSNVTLNIASGRKLQVGNSVTINNTGSNTLQINVTEDVSIGNGFVGKLNITTTQEIKTGGSPGAQITGNLSAGNGFNFGNGTVVTGTCTPSDSHCSGGSVTAPTVTTVAASSITANGVTLNGTVSSNGASTTVTFDRGTTTAYGTSSTASQSPLSSSASGSSVSAVITGLNCNTTYHFRAKGVNSAGTTNGSDLSFTTSACANSYSAYETSISNASAGTATATARFIITRVASSSGNLCQQDGSTCSLRVAAFNSSNAVLTSDTSTLSVTLESCTNVSRAGSTVSCGGSWSNIAAAGTQSVTLASGVNTVTFPFVGNAYEVVRVKLVSGAAFGATTSYSNDYFAIRPASFSVTATDSNATTAGTTRSLTSGANLHSARQPFTLNAQALLSGSGTASNYPGTGSGPIGQTLTTTPTVANGGVSGTLTTGSWSASSGTLTSSTATYTEAGTFTATLQDQSYADIDSADSSTTQRYFSGSASLGRFTPNHFITTVTQACVAGSFSYSRQPFTVVVTAQNASNNTTQNYFGSTGSAQAVTLSDGSASSSGSLGNTSVAASSFSAGVATTTTPAFTFTSAATAPLSITLRAIDADAISSSGHTEGTTTIRSGRIRLGNANGSELLPLSLPLAIEYYSGTSSGWQSNTLDTCTSLSAANFSFSFPTPGNNLQACETSLTLSGTSPSITTKLSAPGAGNSGWTDVSLNLATASGNTCTSSTSSVATSANRAWLQFDWTGSGLANPSGRATFGVMRSGPLIYRTERF